jgi:Icc-related predicted phosphoesterase
MRFLILGCLHGQIPNLHYKNFDAIICTGDFCSDAHRAPIFEAIKRNLANPREKVTWLDIIGKKKAKELIDQSVRDGRAVLEYLNSIGVPVYVVPGNNDWTGYPSSFRPEAQNNYGRMIRGLKNVIDLHGKVLDVGEYTIIGYGICSGPEYPQYASDKRRYTARRFAQKKKEYTRLLAQYGRMFKRANNPVILLSHNVPFNTKIDLIDNPASPRNGQHFGSLLVRDLVKRHKPVVCLGAHMHEHFGAVKIGNTPCVNAGYGAKCNVLLELTPGNGKLSFWGKAQKYR